ncbi:GAF domain-containing protein [bacterium]|nr:GAF domain-containing protein [bacterium]
MKNWATRSNANEIHKKLIDTIKRQNEFLVSVIDALEHPFFVVNAKDHVVEMANKATDSFLDMGKSCNYVFHGVGSSCLMDYSVCPIERIKKNRLPLVEETTRIGTDGTINYFEIRSHPFFDADGKVEKIISYFLNITQRKEMQLDLEWQSSLHLALAELARALIDPEISYKKMALLTLEYSKALTKSKFGFVINIDSESGKALCAAISEDVSQKCQMEEKQRKFVFSRKPDGLFPGVWGKPLNLGKGLFINPSDSPLLFQNLPKGHIAIRNFLGVPAMAGKSPIGEICLGNKPEDFSDQDLKAVERIVDLYSAILQRKKAEEEILNLNRKLEERVSERTKQLNTAVEELEWSNKQLQGLYLKLQKVREEENIKVSRLIHDELGQLLTGIKVDISWCESKAKDFLDAGIKEKAVFRMNEMKESLDNAIQVVRDVSSELRPNQLDILGLIPAIEWQLGQFKRRTGILFEFSHDWDGESVPKSVAVDVFRILQEALTNVVRHSKASRVSVRLQKKKSFLLIECEDNGVGIQKSRISGFESLGLLGMKERARETGGKLKISGKRGKGTLVSLYIPRKVIEHDQNSCG